MTVLTAPTIEEIRKQLQQGKQQKQIAAMYNISQSTVSKIANGKLWSNLK